MATAKAKVNLNEEKGKLKQKFARLTHDNRLLEEGRREELVGKHQTKLAKTKETLDNIMLSL